MVASGLKQTRLQFFEPKKLVLLLMQGVFSKKQSSNFEKVRLMLEKKSESPKVDHYQ